MNRLRAFLLYAMAFAATVSSAYENEIVLTVDGTETKDIATALSGIGMSITKLNGGAAKNRPIVKKGTGTLTMDKAMKNYLGSIYVEDGVVACTIRYAFGKEGNASSAVYVLNGGTVSCAAKDSLNANRIFHIAGYGSSNQGALIAPGDHVNYDVKHVFGKEIILDGDALIAPGPWYRVAAKITMNGHRLEVKNPGGIKVKAYQVISGAGQIVCTGTDFRAASNDGTTFDTASGSSRITLSNGDLRFFNNGFSGAGKHSWPIEFKTAGNIYADSTENFCRDSGNNTIYSPVTLNGNLGIGSQGNTACARLVLFGAVKGDYDVKTWDLEEPLFLHLMNDGNSFKSLLTYAGILYVYEPGALPEKAPLTIKARAIPTSSSFFHSDRYGLEFLSDREYTLSSLTIEDSDAHPPIRVQGGTGSFTSIAKTGTNTLEYFSSIGAQTFDFAGGRLVLPRGVKPGLMEGTNQCASASEVEAAFEGSLTTEDMVMLGPLSSIQRKTDNYTGVSSTKLITYKGYIWNRTGKASTWSFASSVNGPVHVKINNETVIKATQGGLYFGSYKLPKGPSVFEYRAYNNSPRATDWAANSGFMYDPEGRNSKVITDYTLGVDPGDGSLFTCTDEESGYATFETVTFGADTTVDLNGAPLGAENMSFATLPVIQSSATDADAAPGLTVSGTLSLPGEVIGKQVIELGDAKLSLGGTGRIKVVGNRQLDTEEFTYIRSNREIDLGGRLASECIDCDGAGTQITMRLSDDKKSLIVYRPDFLIIVR